MAIVDHPALQQALVQEIIAAPTPPMMIDEVPAGPAEVLLPANAPHGPGVNTLENIAPNNHPLPVQGVGPVGAAVPGELLATGTSPLLRSLYGRPFDS
ncbi:hypothetical protein OPQ81_007959 [Rhizoctonia solani]|nr:hypothetical protein OPQ81_007959 [Rhizoctonia solani]